MHPTPFLQLNLPVLMPQAGIWSWDYASWGCRRWETVRSAEELVPGALGHWSGFCFFQGPLWSVACPQRETPSPPTHRASAPDETRTLCRRLILRCCKRESRATNWNRSRAGVGWLQCGALGYPISHGLWANKRAEIAPICFHDGGERFTAHNVHVYVCHPWWA